MKHEQCDGLGTIVITRIFGENQYDGYCSFCKSPVFGTLFLRSQSNGEPEAPDGGFQMRSV
jgi:hypothetical protein